MRLHENSTAGKIFLTLLRWVPFREAFRTVYDIREIVTALTSSDENIKPDEEFLKDFWGFVSESLKKYQKAKEG